MNPPYGSYIDVLAERRRQLADDRQREREDRATAAIEATGLLAGDEAREAARAVITRLSYPLTHADIPSQTKLVKQVGRG